MPSELYVLLALISFLKYTFEQRNQDLQDRLSPNFYHVVGI